MAVKVEPFPPGHRFVKYDIIGVLGTGGHARVYDAHDPFLDRDVAVKVIAAPQGSRHKLAERAQSEARVLVRIDHPNVVKVYDAGATPDGLVYLVMEKLKGRTLRDVYHDVGRLSVVEALEVAQQICRGVHAAHELGVIHRDLKPENVFVQSDNRIKVLDFGVSKVMGYGVHDTTQRHILHGTVLYMSPEHLQGYGVTCRSDVFALGTLLYEGLYAHPALLALAREGLDIREITDVREVLRMQLGDTPPMLHELDNRIFRHVARFVHRAILKLAEQRYESMADMLAAAHSAWERIEHEQGPDYLVQWRRDLSRPTRPGSKQQPQCDTEQSAMQFSTEIPAARQVTVPGGLTPPAPLTGTTPLHLHASGLPYQTTTPVPPAPDSPRQSPRPVVVVPPLGAPAAFAADTPAEQARISSGVPSPTPAQLATLALAEQETRTAAIDLKAGGQIAADTSPGSARGASASVAPVSHSSFQEHWSAPSRARKIWPSWTRRHVVRIVVAGGAAVGLVMGIAYNVMGRYPTTSAETMSADAMSADAMLAEAMSADARRAVPDREQRRDVQPGSRARPTTPTPGPPPPAPAPPASAAATNQEALTRAAQAGGSAASEKQLAGAAAAAARLPPSEKSARSDTGLEASSAPSLQPSTKRTKPTATPRKAATTSRANKPATAESDGGWLKPHMIHYPEDAPGAAPAAGSARPKMPESGLD